MHLEERGNKKISLCCMDTSGDKPDAFDDGILTKSNHGVILMMEI